MKYFRVAFNFFDQIAIEHVRFGQDGQASSFDLNDIFRFGLRLTDLVVLYTIYYFFFKTGQFIGLLIFNLPMDNLLWSFPVILILYMIEGGLTKKDIFKFRIIIVKGLRASAKYLVICGVDVGVLNILKWLD